MTSKRMINDDYFKWMLKLVYDDRYFEPYSYRKLLSHLHRVEFTYILPMDEDRANNGLYLRYRFSLADGYHDDISGYIEGPCSVLEMMVALALKCEEDFMEDSDFGNRTGQWFWGMIRNLGLGGMFDNRYNEKKVDDIIERFLNRDYDPNGKGGLFTVKDCDVDLRTVEIWHQACWYLDTIM